ncbi:MAG: hypothetical protein J5934_02015 [Succinivibrio sp.]|nr:hypothetical protein [Succinivibrio sp.]
MLTTSKFTPLWLATCLSIALIGCSSNTGSQNNASNAVYGNADSFLLDSVASQDIYETNFSVNLPVDILIPTEPVTEKDI